MSDERRMELLSMDKKYLVEGCLLTEALLSRCKDKNAELQSTIKAQEDVIKRLKEDAERLVETYKWHEYPEEKPNETWECLVYNNNEQWKGGVAEWSYAWFDAQRNEWVILTPRSTDFVTHWRYLDHPNIHDCPITLHTQLMNELGEK